MFYTIESMIIDKKRPFFKNTKKLCHELVEIMNVFKGHKSPA